MRRTLLATAVVAGLLVSFAPGARADHLPEGDKSPCRPGAPAGEQILGYTDEGPQDDPQRELPTIYYNTTEGNTYLGACGGGSAGEPIRFVEVRLTPAGPYVYGTDVAGDVVGDCVPVPPLGTETLEQLETVCASAGSDSDDGRDVAASASVESYYADSFHLLDDSYRTTRREITVSQDGASLDVSYAEGHYTFGDGEYGAGSYYVRRDEATGTVEIGQDWSTGYREFPPQQCRTYVTMNLRTQSPPELREENPSLTCHSPTAAVAVVEYYKALAEAYVDFVRSQVPPTTFGDCRAGAPAEEERLGGAPDSPLAVYYNPSAGYAGFCDAGAVATLGTRSLEVAIGDGTPSVTSAQGLCHGRVATIVVTAYGSCARTTVTAGTPPSVTSTHTGCEDVWAYGASIDVCQPGNENVDGDGATASESPCAVAIASAAGITAAGYGCPVQGDVADSATAGGTVCAVALESGVIDGYTARVLQGCVTPDAPADPAEASVETTVVFGQYIDCESCEPDVTRATLTADARGVSLEHHAGGWDEHLAHRVSATRADDGTVRLAVYQGDGDECHEDVWTYSPGATSPTHTESSACIVE